MSKPKTIGLLIQLQIDELDWKDQCRRIRDHSLTHTVVEEYYGNWDEAPLELVLGAIRRGIDPRR